MSLEEQKRLIRNEVKQKLMRLPMSWVQEESHIIQKAVMESRAYREAETICCYVSFGKEVQTLLILKDALKSGKRVGVPLCVAKGIMEIREIRSFEDLEPGVYGIAEPKKTTRIIEKKEIDCAIIPCVTCDRSGGRMGHGAGYYDRYLADADFLKMILCFEEIMVPKVPMDSYDIAMDAVVSQKGVQCIKRSR